ncbi:DUF1674 domain-containing protein [Stappia sp.]|uniref:DUF1674 domain-containing protein n=1 Tax=Stappia sp. TaxID=1870903 RepID=UPI003A99BF1C
MDTSTKKTDPASGFSQTEIAVSGGDAAEATRRRFEDLPPAAQRALREADARRQAIDARAETLPREVDGRGGLEPTRYEDWEVKGIACDF